MFFCLSNSFIEIKNNDFNFDKFIKNYKVINHRSNQDVYKKFNNIKDFLYFYNTNKYIIE